MDEHRWRSVWVLVFSLRRGQHNPGLTRELQKSELVNEHSETRPGEEPGCLFSRAIFFVFPFLEQISLTSKLYLILSSKSKWIQSSFIPKPRIRGEFLTDHRAAYL